MSGSKNKNYNNQIILEFNPDSIITDNTSTLLKNGLITKSINTQYYVIKGESGKCPKDTLGDMTLWAPMADGEIRIYVRGHGDWKSQTIGGWKASDVGDLIGACQYGGHVKTVSVTGCNLGRDKNSADATRVMNSADSFGAQLHSYLWKPLKIKTVLYARVFNVSFDPDGTKFTRPEGGVRQHRRAHSKIRYCWNGDTQYREWAYEKEQITTVAQTSKSFDDWEDF
jgi:hypothetical protein